MDSDCIFCKIAKGKIPSKKIFENDNFFSILDANPIVRGHSLVISKKHFETILDLSDELYPSFLDCIKKTAINLMKEFNAEGFNLIQNNFEVAGQVVKHFHVHVLPRRKDDGFKLSV